MAAGQQPTLSLFNNQLTSFCLQLRHLCEQITDMALQANKQGNAGLVALGAASADATDILTCYSYLTTIAGVYNGTVQQGGTGGTGAILFNFDDALAHVRGGLTS